MKVGYQHLHYMRKSRRWMLIRYPEGEMPTARAAALRGEVAHSSPRHSSRTNLLRQLLGEMAERVAVAEMCPRRA
jgi:hypothetical protein